MKKSNWIILGILVIASIFYLVLWYVLGFNLVDDPLDLVITVIWWLVILTICFLISWSENKRRRAIRTAFLAPGLIYNPEAGIVQVEGKDYTTALQRILDNLTYGFDKEDVSSEQPIRFTLIVRSDKFSDNGDTWSGEVVNVSNPKNPFSFEDRRELAQLINRA